METSNRKMAVATRPFDALTQLQAEAVWFTLVAVCGAYEDEREDFVRLVQETPKLEYRFRGVIGSGGKVNLSGRRDVAPQVTCYKEDETPEGNRRIENANRLLSAIAKLW